MDDTHASRGQHTSYTPLMHPFFCQSTIQAVRYLVLLLSCWLKALEIIVKKGISHCSVLSTQQSPKEIRRGGFQRIQNFSQRNDRGSVNLGERAFFTPSLPSASYIMLCGSLPGLSPFTQSHSINHTRRELCSGVTEHRHGLCHCQSMSQTHNASHVPFLAWPIHFTKTNKQTKNIWGCFRFLSSSNRIAECQQ